MLPAAYQESPHCLELVENDGLPRHRSWGGQRLDASVRGGLVASGSFPSFDKRPCLDPAQGEYHRLRTGVLGEQLDLDS